MRQRPHGAPRGGGLDCHRTWEMLYFGMIPIVKTSSLDSLFSSLPVIILQDWDEICALNLEKEAMRLAKLLPVRSEVFTAKFWMQDQH